MPRTAQKTLPLAVTMDPVIVTAELLPASAAPGLPRVPYSFQMEAAGGRPPYVWSATGLPRSLTMDANGLISGTIVAGTVTHLVDVTFTVTDSSP